MNITPINLRPMGTPVKLGDNVVIHFADHQQRDAVVKYDGDKLGFFLEEDIPEAEPIGWWPIE